MKEGDIPRLTPGLFLRGIRGILAGKPRTNPPGLEENPLLQVIYHRRSLRKFRDNPIPDDIFEAILEAGRLAPSAVNLQTWSFAEFNRERWRDKFGREIPFHADRAVLVMGDVHRIRRALTEFPQSSLVEYTIAVINASLAAMNMTIAAESLGIGSCMLSETGQTGLLDVGYLQEKLHLPQGVIPLLTIVFGYPKGGALAMPPRFPMQQICFRDGAYHESDSSVLRDWVEQMTAGYKASFPSSSLQKQLEVYRLKIAQAEKELEDIISQIE